MPCTSLPYLSLTYQHLFFRTVILAYSHRADFDRAERADVDGDRGHLTASMDSPWHKPPMSRATRELNRPSSTSPSRPSARTRGAHPIVSGGPGRRGLAARVAGGSSQAAKSAPHATGAIASSTARSLRISFKVNLGRFIGDAGMKTCQ